MEIYEKIKKRREELGLTMEEVAQALGVNRTTISRYESKDISKISIDVIPPLAKVLQVSPAYLMGWDGTEDVELPKNEPTTKIKVFAPLCCGNGMFIDDNEISVISVPTSMLKVRQKELFAQYASGDSMKNKNINDGDLLIFSKEQCESGDIGCFCIDENMATCKILKIIDEQIMLMPANDKYEPIFVKAEDFRCIGKLVLIINKV